jgi:hypothetical protein
VKEFQERAVSEQTELGDRLGKIREFIRSEEFKTLDFAEQVRLQMQEHAMFLYLYFLAERINNFGRENDDPQISQISADFQKEKA